MDAKAAARERFESNREGLIELSHRIHAHPEPGFEEERACAWLCDSLDDAGFAVERGIFALARDRVRCISASVPNTTACRVSAMPAATM